MRPDHLPPMFVIIGFRNNWNDRRKIGSSGNAEKEKKDVESDIALHPLKSKQGNARPHKSNDHGSLITPNGSKPSCDQKGETITYGEGSEKSTGCSMGNGKAVLNQGKDGGEYSAGGKVKKPETPEDKKREKFHLLHSF